MSSSRPLLAYENFGGPEAPGVTARAQSILEAGWRLNAAYPLIQFGLPIPWDESAQEYRSWVFNLHCWDMLDPLLAAYSMDGGVEFLRASIDVAIDWTERFLHVAAGEDASGFAWYDMAVGLRAQRLAYLVDAALMIGLLRPDQQALLEACLVRHGEELEDDSKIIFHNNHGFYQVAGQLAMARRFRGRLDGMDAHFEQGQQRLLTILQTQFSLEGVHKEHSPDYHRMVYISLCGLVDAGLVESAEVLEQLRSIEDQLAWFIYPDGTLVNFGDSDSREMLLTREHALRTWRGEVMRFVSSSGRIGAHPEQRMRSYPESGYFVARSDWAGDAAASGYLGFNAAFHSRTHKHADDLSLVWFEHGSQVFIDSGRYGYLGRTKQGDEDWLDGFWYSDRMRMYAESTRAHNAVEIDGRNSPRRQVKPFGSALGRSGCSDKGVFFAEGEVRPYEGVRFARSVLWLPGSWLLTLDWVHDNKGHSHDVKQYWHLAPSFSVERSDSGFVCLSSMHEAPLHVVSLLEGAQFHGPWLSEEEPVQGYYSPKEKVATGANVVALNATGSTVAFATLAAFGDRLEVDFERNQSVPSGRSHRFEFVLDGVRHTIRVVRPVDGEFEVAFKKK